MINPAYWWCTGTELDEKFYFDCYCPFGARSMPAVFQRLSDAIRVVMLRRTSVDALLGMLDDFLGVVFREPEETNEELLRRGRRAAVAFDQELNKMGIAKQGKKDSPPAWSITWLGFHLNTRNQTLGIPEEKLEALQQTSHTHFMKAGAWLEEVTTKVLEKRVGTLCHYSNAWPLGKTLLWPLYNLMTPHRAYTAEGKAYMLSEMVQLDGECREALDEWYMQVCTVGLTRQFKCCCGRNSVTQLGVWLDRKGGRRAAEGIKGRQLMLVSPWEVSIGCSALIASLAGRELVKQVLAMAIKLLKTFLDKYVERCGEVVEIHTNVGKFVEYIAKDCYPKGLNRQSYKESIEIHRYLGGTGGRALRCRASSKPTSYIRSTGRGGKR